MTTTTTDKPIAEIENPRAKIHALDEEVIAPFEYVDGFEWSYESYRFDETNIYLHKPTGRIFYASDSGCSCPSPFEDTTVSDLTEITSLHDFDGLVEARRPLQPPTWDTLDEVERNYYLDEADYNATLGWSRSEANEVWAAIADRVARIRPRVAELLKARR